MITRIKLENWKSYAQAELHIDPLSVLIGTNSSGKSNALDALLLLTRAASGSLLTDALQGDRVQSALRGGVEWAARKPGDTFALTAICRADDFTDYEYRIECKVTELRCDVFSEQLTRFRFRPRSRSHQNGERGGQFPPIRLFWTDPLADDSPTITTRLYNEKGGLRREQGRSQAVLFQLQGQKLRQEIQDGVSLIVQSLREIFILDPIPSHMRGYSPLAERLEPDARNIAGVIAVLTRERKDVENTLTKYVRKLPERDVKRVFAETVGKFETDAMLYCEENWLDEKTLSIVDARGMSDGTLRFLAILTALLTRPEGSLLVIEEVDNGLHPSRAQLLLDMLREVSNERGVDVLVTTHNPALLDAMGNKMVPFISVAHRDPHSGCSVLRLLEDITNLPKLLAQGTVGALSSKGAIEKTLLAEEVVPEVAVA